MLEPLINSLRFDRPWWLYESAPYLYLAVGLLVISHLNGPLARLSAAMLILAGLHVLSMRWTYRRARPGGSGNELVPVPLLLDSSCQYDHEVIDAQHRELFVASHGVVKLAKNGHPDEFKLLVGDLIQQIRRHFQVEERFLMMADPAIAHAQRAEHEALAIKMDSLHRSFLAGRIERHELLNCVVYEAVVEHTKKDKPIFEKAFWG